MMTKKLTLGLVILAVCAGILTTGGAARAESEEQALVEKARMTAERLLSDPGYPTLRRWMKQAKGVLVMPSLLKAGFLFGGEGGSGVLLARGAKGTWSYPAFYSMASGSFGLQIGVQDSEVLFVIMTEKGLKSIVNSNFKLGVDASVAAGPLGGAGVEGATTASFGADIYSFSRNRGLFGGMSFEGTVAIEQAERNRNYYGRAASAADIVIARKFTNRRADGLRRALNVK